MLNSGKKIRTLRDKKNIILTLVLSEKKILSETKNHNPPFKLNGRSLTTFSETVAWFPPTFKNDCHDTTEILLKVALSTIT